MVGFIKEEEQKKVQSLTPKSSKETSAISFNSTFFEPFLDFDSIKEFFEDNPEMASLERIGLDGSGKEISEAGVESLNLVDDPVLKEDRSEFGERVNLGSSVEEEIGKITLGSGSSLVLGGFGCGVDVKEVCIKDKTQRNDDDDDESGSDSESESESSSSSSSGSDDGDSSDSDVDKVEDNTESGKKEANLKRDDEIEEGEITDVNGEEMVGGGGGDDEEEEEGDNMIDWSDVEPDDAEVDEDDSDLGEPIKSKNELKVLPHVPPVDVTLQETHRMLPVGVVSSVLGHQVIVEGVEKHDPLNEGSILWITEKRLPLGLVDEIFGPVKNPYYIVRYNSESEVPMGICAGTLVSFVPEFADHIIGNKNLYKKGYDASGLHDEEVSDESEFSDDEKEQEYRRMQRMSKRAVNDQTVGKKKKNRKNVKDRERNWKNNDRPSSSQQVPTCGGQIPLGLTTAQQNASTGFVSPFPPPMAQSGGVFSPPAGFGVPGMPSHQLQSILSGFLPGNMACPAPNELQRPYQMSMPFTQQFNPMPGPAVPNASQQLNTFAQPMMSMWPGVAGQNSSNQPAMGLCWPFQPTQPAMNMMNMGPRGMQIRPPNPGFNMTHVNPATNMIAAGNGAMHSQPNNPPTNMLDMGPNSSMQQRGLVPGHFQVPQQFNAEASSINGRRKPRRRGGGRFAGGRDPKQ